MASILGLLQNTGTLLEYLRITSPKMVTGYGNASTRTKEQVKAAKEYRYIEISYSLQSVGAEDTVVTV